MVKKIRNVTLSVLTTAGSYPAALTTFPMSRDHHHCSSPHADTLSPPTRTPEPRPPARFLSYKQDSSRGHTEVDPGSVCPAETGLRPSEPRRGPHVLQQVAGPSPLTAEPHATVGARACGGRVGCSHAPASETTAAVNAHTQVSLCFFYFFWVRTPRWDSGVGQQLEG